METPFHRLDTHHRLGTQIHNEPLPLNRNTMSLPDPKTSSINLKPPDLAKS